jgi:hypothetical protein
MAQFVLVASGVTASQFEKAIEIKIESAGKVSLIPQAVNQHGAQTQSMNTTRENANAEEILHVVRLEWTEAGAEFGARIVKALAHRNGPMPPPEPPSGMYPLPTS